MQKTKRTSSTRKNKKMSNAPIYFALAQAQFNTISAMTKYADEIQDRLRGLGYTLLEPHDVAEVQITQNAGTIQQPIISTIKTWHIIKSDRSASFVLGPSNISFQTTYYEESTGFIAELLKALRIVHDVVKLEHVSRLGLRYLDAVFPNEGETVQQYLADGLRGIDIDEKQRHTIIESVFDTSPGSSGLKGTLIARVYKLQSALTYPPDLSQVSLQPRPKFASQPNKRHAILDTDHFAEGILKMDFVKIEEQFFSLHQIMRKVFDTTVTSHALKVWE